MILQEASSLTYTRSFCHTEETSNHAMPLRWATQGIWLCRSGQGHVSGLLV